MDRTSKFLTEPLNRERAGRTCRRSGIMSAFRGLQSSEGHHGAPGRSLMTHSRLFDDPSPSRRRLLANAVAGQNATGAVEFFASILER